MCEADWLTVCRRLNLGLAGCGLSLEDIRSLEKVPEEERIDYWLEFLLRDPRTFDYLAERFTRAFVGTNNGPFLLFRRRKFKLWLADELEKGVPYDRIVRQLISAEGLWTDKPAVNFITATMDEDDKGRADPIRLAGRTSRAFLGMRVDCLQCHDDFLGNVKLGSQEQPVEGTQKDFHRLGRILLWGRHSEQECLRRDSGRQVLLLGEAPWRRGGDRTRGECPFSS